MTPPAAIPAVRDGMFLWQEHADVTTLEPATLPGNPPVRCCFTTRHAGTTGRPLNLSFDLGARPEVLAQRQQVLRTLGVEQSTLFSVRQVHGNDVCIVDADAVQLRLAGVRADALVTTLPYVPLGVLVADCLPIVLYGLEPRVLAVVHAGRMGTYHRIVQTVIQVLQARFAVSPQQLYAVMGPSIGGCCYHLDARAVDPFRQHFEAWEQFFTPQGEGLWTMSLTRANDLQLRDAGVPAAHIHATEICTVCHNAHFHSHRAEDGEAGRGMGIAVLLPES